MNAAEREKLPKLTTQVTCLAARNQNLLAQVLSAKQASIQIFHKWMKKGAQKLEYTTAGEEMSADVQHSLGIERKFLKMVGISSEMLFRSAQDATAAQVEIASTNVAHCNEPHFRVMG